MRRIPALLLSVCAVIGFATALPATAAPTVGTGAGGDAVVVAVIDSGFTPYHYDYLASQMPQHQNADPGDDLPLDQPASQWLHGFDLQGTASYNRLDITLPSGPNDDPAALETADAATWGSVQSSERSVAANLYWLPGTKVIGAATFESGAIQGPTNEHGTGTTSVSVGNIHGSCPECLLVFLGGDYEKAINWAMRQPWIDAISNSYGISTGVAVRDRVYNGCALHLQKQATLRGQNVFFSAGNGVENAFTIPNSTLFSCQEAPDWITTVGAVNSTDIVRVTRDQIATFPEGPGGSPGHGRPADIASIGDSYPSAYEATTVSGKGELGFGGTSNATPVIAGSYARALWEARRLMAGVSRTQVDGLISVGAASCGATRPNCEIGDGRLTRAELMNRLNGSARLTVGTSPAGVVTVGDPMDPRLLAQGRGALVGRMYGDAQWASERTRLTGPMFGTAAAPSVHPDVEAYATALSYCSQHLWGFWNQGAWTQGEILPTALAPKWPTRTALTQVCPSLQAPPRRPYERLYGDPDA